MNDVIVVATATLSPFIAQLDLTPVPDATAIGIVGLLVWYFVKRLDVQVQEIAKKQDTTLELLKEEIRSRNDVK